MPVEKKSKLNFWILCFIFFLSGIWFLVTHADSRSPQRSEPSSIEAVKTLPYVAWTPIDRSDIGKSGVVSHDPARAAEGINIYYCEALPSGCLMDMQGKVLHIFADKRTNKAPWKLIEPYQNNFLVLIEDDALFMMDWDSNIKWIKRGRFHHDIAVADNGDIYALISNKRRSPDFSASEPILDNELVILTKTGEVKKRISFAKMISQNKVLLDVAKNQKKKEYFYGKDAWDVFHTNTIEIVDTDPFPEGKKLFAKGDVLFCIRQLDIIGAIDVEKEKIVWVWGLSKLEYPHHPSLLDNGNILIFDNGTRRGYSSVIELNPATGQIEWEYIANPRESFYSPTRGAAQRLPNGNTLITESDRGRVFEVTKDGQTVWKFYSPEIDTVNNTRATIYRMRRIIDSEKYPWLKKLK